MPDWGARITEAAAFMRGHGIGDVALAIVLGTGLGGLVDDLADPVAIAYADIPHFPVTGVTGHGGRVIAGRLGGRAVLLFQGRAHHYERGDPAAMRVPLGTLEAFGRPPLLLTNAAGAVRADWPSGQLVAIEDHIGFAAPNPLIGEASENRFVPMNDSYDPALRDALGRAAVRAGVPLASGVYMWFTGPSFETPAEIRAARVLGADLVGMSTVPEVILARFYGLRVAALSLVTNPAAGVAPGRHTHDDTQAAGRAAGPNLRRLVAAFVSELPDPGRPT